MFPWLSAWKKLSNKIIIKQDFSKQIYVIVKPAIQYFSVV